MNAPCLGQDPDFLEFLKLLASWDGSCFSTNLRMKRIGREEREAREREGERDRDRENWARVRPVSDLFQTCFRHLKFAKSCPESPAPA